LASDHFHVLVMTKKKRIEVSAMSAVTAIPYAPARPLDFLNTSTSPRQAIISR